MPHTARFRHIDAFASAPFTGNSAAIYRADAFPEDSLMQLIAREHNLSETAWYVPDGTGEADYVLRWFTPTVEVELCGHATLAAGHHVLSEEKERESVRFRTVKGAGILEVARDTGREAPAGGAHYRMSLPAWQSEKTVVPALVAALGRIPGEVRVTTNAAEDSYLAVFDDEDTVRALAPDFKALAAIGNVLVIATAPATGEDGGGGTGGGAGGGGIDVVSRVFAPGAGVDEDPVTGSAHAMLTPYWAERLGRPSFEAYQASARGGYISCRHDGERAVLGGACVDVIAGDVTLP